MMRFEVGGVRVLIDYAHNPDGLRGFLKVADHIARRSGRLGMLLGHAGNRKDADIEELARVAAEFRPDLVVVKEDEAHLRGRAPGEIPRIIRAELCAWDYRTPPLPIANSEVEAARYALDWARPGDVLALPVHSPNARVALVAMLDKLNRRLGSGAAGGRRFGRERVHQWPDQVERQRKHDRRGLAVARHVGQRLQVA